MSPYVNYPIDGSADVITSAAPLTFMMGPEDLVAYRNALVSREISTLESAIKFVQRHLNFNRFRMEVDVTNENLHSSFLRTIDKDTEELLWQVEFTPDTRMKIVMPLEFCKLEVKEI